LNNNFEILRDRFDGKATTVELSNTIPTLTADALSSAISRTINKFNCDLNIVVDVTTFTRESLLILLKILFEDSNLINNTNFIYTGSESMSDEWLSSGLKELRPVLGYAGEFSPASASHLIILLGFEVERAKEIINNTEPNLLSIGIGHQQESITSYFYDKNLEHLQELCQFYGFEYSPFYYSLTDPVVSMNDIGNYLADFTNHNNIIAPLNNKISTIGAGLLAIKDQKIQICYSQMNIYNYTNYSSPSDNCYLFKIT
jgi:hypothetical protein